MLDKKDAKIVVLGVAAGLIIANLFIFMTLFKNVFADSETASHYGSFIGGYFGTFFSFLSIVVLFITLKNQRESSEIEKFENKYFQLIKLHRENVQEITTGGTRGRKVFVLLLREFRFIIQILERELDLTLQKKLDIAYHVLHYGVGPNSSRILMNTLRSYSEEMARKVVEIFELELLKNNRAVNNRVNYVLFEGHQSRLSHYYRHLYQTVKYVHSQKNINKYDYVKILRAQLSNHELALLFLNSCSSLGQNWRSEGIIERYGLIKNLPKDFIDSENEVDIKKIYPHMLFEWEE